MLVSYYIDFIPFSTYLIFSKCLKVNCRCDTPKYLSVLPKIEEFYYIRVVCYCWYYFPDLSFTDTWAKSYPLSNPWYCYLKRKFSDPRKHPPFQWKMETWTKKGIIANAQTGAYGRAKTWEPQLWLQYFPLPPLF